MSVTREETKPVHSALRDESFPVPDRRFGENSLRLLVPHTWVQTQRFLIRFGRDPMTLFLNLILPIAFLTVVDVVLGDTISQVTGHDALHGSVPMVALQATMAGALVGVVSISTEQTDGLLARLWVVPVHRVSGLLARAGAEGIRVGMNSLVVLGVGLLFGLRFGQGFLATLGWLCVPIVFGVTFSVLVLTIALYWPSTILVDVIVVVNSLVLFFCTGFVPLDQYPEWIQPVVEHQPVSYAIETMRGLSMGGPVLEPAIGTLLWCGGILLLCVGPMVAGYRRASMHG